MEAHTVTPFLLLCLLCPVHSWGGGGGGDVMMEYDSWQGPSSSDYDQYDDGGAGGGGGGGGGGGFPIDILGADQGAFGVGNIIDVVESIGVNEATGGDTAIGGGGVESVSVGGGGGSDVTIEGAGVGKELKVEKGAAPAPAKQGPPPAAPPSPPPTRPVGYGGKRPGKKPAASSYGGPGVNIVGEDDAAATGIIDARGAPSVVGLSSFGGQVSDVEDLTLVTKAVEEAANKQPGDIYEQADFPDPAPSYGGSRGTNKGVVKEAEDIYPDPSYARAAAVPHTHSNIKTKTSDLTPNAGRLRIRTFPLDKKSLSLAVRDPLRAIADIEGGGEPRHRHGNSAVAVQEVKASKEGSKSSAEWKTVGTFPSQALTQPKGAVGVSGRWPSTVDNRSKGDFMDVTPVVLHLSLGGAPALRNGETQSRRPKWIRSIMLIPTKAMEMAMPMPMPGRLRIHTGKQRAANPRFVEQSSP